jgi:hypothetical protein
VGKAFGILKPILKMKLKIILVTYGIKKEVFINISVLIYLYIIRGVIMERESIYNKMKDVLSSWYDYKQELLDKEAKKDELWGKINPIKQKIEYDVYCKAEEKRTESQKEIEVKQRVFDSEELNYLYLKLNEVNREINKIKLEIEYKENEFKALRVAYGIYMV